MSKEKKKSSGKKSNVSTHSNSWIEDDEDENSSLTPVSKLSDGLFIGNYEAALSQEVLFINKI
jgi:hypothetical protein